jgi:hypothetical protein
VVSADPHIKGQSHRHGTVYADCVVVSTEPGSHATEVLMDETTVSGWVLTEAVVALEVVRERRPAMQALGAAAGRTS